MAAGDRDERARSASSSTAGGPSTASRRIPRHANGAMRHSSRRAVTTLTGVCPLTRLNRRLSDLEPQPTNIRTSRARASGRSASPSASSCCWSGSSSPGDRRRRRGHRARLRLLWVRDLDRRRTALDARAEVAGRERAHRPRRRRAASRAAAPTADERYPRSKFLELSTLGLGGVIGGLVTVPALGFMVLPPFLKQGVKDHDLGPLDRLSRRASSSIATFMADPRQGDVSRRTAFVRNNGLLERASRASRSSRTTARTSAARCSRTGRSTPSEHEDSTTT